MLTPRRINPKIKAANLPAPVDEYERVEIEVISLIIIPPPQMIPIQQRILVFIDKLFDFVLKLINKVGGRASIEHCAEELRNQNKR